VAAIHDELLNISLDRDFDISRLGPRLDDLGSAATEIEVLGETKVEAATTQSETTEKSTKLDLRAQHAPSAGIGSTEKSSTNEGNELRISHAGSSRYRLHFGRVSNALSKLVAELPSKLYLSS
jgi:hypothetical protein